jgi:hypothetical protein
MTVTLNLSQEAERRLRELAAQSGQTVEQYLEGLVTAPPAGTRAGQTELSPAAWETAFRAWAASHQPLPQDADDSREGIYEGRGE